MISFKLLLMTLNKFDTLDKMEQAEAVWEVTFLADRKEADLIGKF
jgi:hypothetical protein